MLKRGGSRWFVHVQKCSMIQAIDDHICNRLVSGLDLIAFIMITPEIMQNQWLKRIHEGTSNTNDRLFRITSKFTFSEYATISMNLSGVFGLLSIAFFAFKGFDYRGPFWFQSVLWIIVGVLTAPGVFLLVASFLGSAIAIVTVLAARKTLNILAVLVFISTRLAVIYHG